MLVVDDEPANTSGVVRTFHRELEIETLTDPLLAMERLRTCDYEVLLVDQKMPRLGGLELCIESARRSQSTARIVMTGYLDVRDLVGCINEGAVYAYLAKPFRREDLRQVVFEALELVSRRRALPPPLPPNIAHILVVDSDETQAISTARLLSGRVQVVHTMAEALAIDVSHSLVITEPQLRDGDGLELLVALRGRAAYRCLSGGRADLEVLIDAINRAHIDAFLRRPLEREGISALLDRLVRISSSRIERP
jgi:DNA-binding NtrC family response regulator